MQSDDGIASAAIMEAADRLKELEAEREHGNFDDGQQTDSELGNNHRQPPARDCDVRGNF